MHTCAGFYNSIPCFDGSILGGVALVVEDGEGVSVGPSVQFSMGFSNSQVTGLDISRESLAEQCPPRT